MMAIYILRKGIRLGLNEDENNGIGFDTIFI